MSIFYKIIIFLWFFYMISFFVNSLDIFDDGIFSGVADEPVMKDMLETGSSGYNKSVSILDYFFYYDVELGPLGNFHLTSMTIIGACIAIGLAITLIWAPDIRILLSAITIGMLLVMFNSSWTFMHKILTVKGGSSMTMLVIIMGASIVFIGILSLLDKATQSGGGAED